MLFQKFALPKFYNHHRFSSLYFKNRTFVSGFFPVPLTTLIYIIVIMHNDDDDVNFFVLFCVWFTNYIRQCLMIMMMMMMTKTNIGKTLLFKDDQIFNWWWFIHNSLKLLEYNHTHNQPNDFERFRMFTMVAWRCGGGGGVYHLYIFLC